MIDITEMAEDVGLKFRTSLSPAAWEIFNQGGRIQGRDLQKRLSRMLEVLQIALTQRKGAKEKVLCFSTHLEGRGNLAPKLVLKAAVENRPCGPAAITVMLASESGERLSERVTEKLRKSGA